VEIDPRSIGWNVEEAVCKVNDVLKQAMTYGS
jgi:hypothetical protein